jgi:hypothetical protein
MTTTLTTVLAAPCGGCSTTYAADGGIVSSTRCDWHAECERMFARQSEICDDSALADLVAALAASVR